jgi:hypothetical protein
MDVTYLDDCHTLDVVFEGLRALSKRTKVPPTAAPCQSGSARPGERFRPYVKRPPIAPASGFDLLLI